MERLKEARTIAAKRRGRSAEVTTDRRLIIAATALLDSGIRGPSRSGRSAMLRELKGFGSKILRTPMRAPKANAFCERLVGTMRRECLDWVIPLNEKHLRGILREWVTLYNRGRPHASLGLGPGIPESKKSPPLCGECRRHELPEAFQIGTKDVLGGLHHEYWLKKLAA